MNDREYEEKIAQIKLERDTAIKQLRDDYGVGLGQEKDPDVIKVVRCKDCKYFELNNGNSYCDFCSGSLPYDIFLVDPNDFCKWGKRKENENAVGKIKEPYATTEVATEKYYDLLIERIEKQKAKKPMFDGNVKLYMCPICHNYLAQGDNCCDECGQKLDWSVEE